MVQSLDGIPILVLEVKKPHIKESIVDNYKVLGQLYDYMGRLRSFFGQIEIFGICTSLQEWKVCWFPDTSSASVSSTQKAMFASTSSHDLSQRILHTSPMMDLCSKQLPMTILSVLLKSLNSKYERVDLFSESRSYIELSSNTWNWKKITSFTPSFSLHYPHMLATHFYVVRFFHEGRDGRVKLVFTQGRNSSLAIIKQFFSSSDYDTERLLWKEIYDISVIFNESNKSIVLPFCFHVIEDKDGSMQFNFDLTFWTRESPATPGDANLLIEEQHQYLSNLDPTNFDCAGIAQQAVEYLTSQGFVHDDLEWRHVAVMPIFENGRIIDLKPILLDLTSARKVEDRTAAENYMNNKLKSLLKLSGK